MRVTRVELTKNITENFEIEIINEGSKRGILYINLDGKKAKIIIDRPFPKIVVKAIKNIEERNIKVKEDMEWLPSAKSDGS